MPPASGADAIQRHHFGEVRDQQLIRGEPDSRQRRICGIFKERPQQAHSAKLNSNTQAVVIATVFGDEGAV